MPRDEQQPSWQWFRQRYTQLEPRLTELWERQGRRPLEDGERAQLTRAVLDGSREEAWHAVIGALAAGGAVTSVLDALTRAASERLWRFDAALEANPTGEGGWLQASQPLLYMRALRELSTRHRRPSFLRLVLFGVHAVHQLKALDQPAERWLAVDAKGRLSVVDRELMLGELEDAVLARDAGAAQQAALAYLALGGSVAGAGSVLTKLLLENLYARADVSGHALQLVASACDLASSLPEPDRGWPLRAVVRMLASPLRERKLAATLSAAKLELEHRTP
jgi:hypothetical protein